MLTLVEEWLGGPDTGKCRHKGVGVSAEREGPESPEILVGSHDRTKG